MKTTFFLFIVLKMSEYIPKKSHMRHVFAFYFNLKKSANEIHRLLVETYGEYAVSERKCRQWFRRYTKRIYVVKEKNRPGGSEQTEDVNLEASLNEDARQTEEDSLDGFHFKNTVMALEHGHWVKYEMTERHYKRVKKNKCNVP